MVFLLGQLLSLKESGVQVSLLTFHHMTNKFADKLVHTYTFLMVLLRILDKELLSNKVLISWLDLFYCCSCAMNLPLL